MPSTWIPLDDDWTGTTRGAGASAEVQDVEVDELLGPAWGAGAGWPHPPVSAPKVLEEARLAEAPFPFLRSVSGLCKSGRRRVT